MGKGLGNLSATFSVARERKLRPGTEQLLLATGHSRDPLAATNRRRQFRPVQFLELRLVVEKVDVGRAAGHEKVNDALGFRRKMQSLHRTDGLLSLGGEKFRAQQGGQRERADAGSRAAKEMPAGHRLGEFLFQEIHSTFRNHFIDVQQNISDRRPCG